MGCRIFVDCVRGCEDVEDDTSILVPSSPCAARLVQDRGWGCGKGSLGRCHSPLLDNTVSPGVPCWCKQLTTKWLSLVGSSPSSPWLHPPPSITTSQSCTLRAFSGLLESAIRKSQRGAHCKGLALGWGLGIAVAYPLQVYPLCPA